MDLELLFDGLHVDLLDAVADVRVADLAVADGPAEGPSATTPLVVAADRPTVVSLDLPVAADAYEPGLLVRVRGRTPDDGRVEFFTTGATPVTPSSEGPVRVLLHRIA